MREEEIFYGEGEGEGSGDKGKGSVGKVSGGWGHPSPSPHIGYLQYNCNCSSYIKETCICNCMGAMTWE